MSTPDTRDERIARAELLDYASSQLGNCSTDEMRVVCAFLRRMEVARATVGPVDLTAADWHAGAATDLLDAAFYHLAMRLTSEARARAEVAR